MIGTVVALAVIVASTVLPGTQIAIDPDDAWMVSEVLAYDESKKFVVIRLSEAMQDATDTNAEAAGRLFHRICTQGYVLGVKPAVIGGWTASRVNPMSVEWTRVLIGEAPDTGYEPADAGGDRGRGRQHGIKPKGRTYRYEVNGKDVYIRTGN